MALGVIMGLDSHRPIMASLLEGFTMYQELDLISSVRAGLMWYRASLDLSNNEEDIAFFSERVKKTEGILQRLSENNSTIS